MARLGSGRDPERQTRGAKPAPAALDATAAASLEHAQRLTAQGREQDALITCKRLYAQAPRNPDVLGLLGYLCGRTGQLEKALMYLAEALLLAPRRQLVLYHLAGVYLQAGAPMHALHALRSYQIEVDQAPIAQDVPEVSSLTVTLTMFVHQTPGIAQLAPAAQERAMMVAERGRMRLLFSGDPENALAPLREAIRLAPRYPQPRNNLSLAYFYNGQRDQAVSTLETTLRDVDPDNVYALATLAFVRWAGGEEGEASRAVLSRAVALLEPGSRILDRTRVAEVAGVLGDHALAHAVLAGPGVPAPDPTDPLEGPAGAVVHIRLLAAALANLGQSEEAAALLRDSTTLPGDAAARRLLAAIDQGDTLSPAVGGGYPYLGWEDLLAAPVLRRAVAGGAPRRSLRPPPPPAPAAIVAALTRLCPRLPLVAALLIWMGEPALENLGLTLLALAGTPAADAVLDAHLRGTAGSYAGRQQAGYALLDSGRLPNGTQVPFWSGTDWTEIRLFRLVPPVGRDPAALIATLTRLLERLAAPSEQ
ncbi:MAG TPA: hypothetical protein VM536_14480 [Chloroflexia bacterium]|nr:hypothetical protein [Chloroflexia bacterium]